MATPGICFSVVVLYRQPPRMSEKSVRYAHGHHASVLKSHTWRTAENSAAYLIPFINHGASILDVGCGPGSISTDFSDLVGCEGCVVGVDSEPSILASAAAEHNHPNLTFQVADVTKRLPFPNEHFDIVHAHQVLQHLAEPTLALQEMKRVCRKGGIVAARDADYHGMVWSPQTSGMDLWMSRYQDAARHCGGNPDVGRSLLRLANEARFRKVQASASVWCFADNKSRAWWGNLWAERVQNSQLAVEMRKLGTTNDEIELMRNAWLEWAHDKNGWFTVLHGEILCFP